MRSLNRFVIAELFIFAVLLCCLGYLAHCQITDRLNESLEKTVLRHISTVAYSIETTMRREITDMHTAVKTVENGEITPEELLHMTAAFKSSVFKGENFKFGVMRSDGTSIGKSTLDLSPEDFYTISDVFDGEDVVEYRGRAGLIFAVPIHINGEVYTFCERYSNDGLSKLFGVISYDGAGAITIVGNNKSEFDNISGKKSAGEDFQDGGLIAKSITSDELYQKVYSSPGFMPVAVENLKEILKHRRAATLYESEGKVFLLFGQIVYNDKFVVLGCVDRAVVAVGLDAIHLAVIGVTFLIILVLIMGIRGLVRNAENAELKVEKASAIQASKTKSEFLSNMSHEIRTPINAVLGMNEMILRESTDEHILEYAESVRTAGTNLLGIVNDILDFSKIEAGKMEIIPVEYELSSMLNDLVNMIRQRAEKKDLMFMVNADKDLPAVLFGDEIRIKQVVTNILTNAVKYTEKGFVVLKLEIIKKDGDKIIIRFSVKDTGIGIKPEDIQKLYSAFERIEEKRNRTIEGTGLGMNITQKLLALMNADLQVESVYGKGSTFWFDIEQRIIKDEPIGDFEEAYRKSLKQHKAYHEKFTAPTAKILVVDDTVMNLTVVKGLLKQTKIKIDTAESGFKCLELVAQNKYDIIFLDIRMPEMDGIETLQKMKELADNPNAATPVISLTANAISGAREQYIAAGFKDYLTKPINSVKLEELIMKYLPKEKLAAADKTAAEPVEENLNLPEWLMNIDGLNVKEGVEHCGDSDSYLDALKVFANSIKRGADEIENYFVSGDWKNYTTKVHALKSSARVIGASELSDRALKLEDAGNANRLEEIQNDTAPLLELYRSYTEKLSQLIEDEETDSNKPQIEAENLAEAFEAMKEAVASFDIDSIGFVLQELDEYQLPQNEIKRYKNIKDAVAKLDWEKIKAALEAEPEPEKPQIEAENLAEAYAAMKDAAKSFDIDSIEFVLQELGEYQLPENEIERYKNLKDAVSRLDWNKINELLE